MKKLVSFIIAAMTVALMASTQARAEGQLAVYCCDGYGVHRCVLENPVPPGNSCFCFGQGYGIACY